MKKLKLPKDKSFILVLMYMAICQIAPLFGFSPVFFQNWRLFDHWATHDNKFYDVSYEQNGQTKFISQHSPEFSDRMDMVGLYYHLIDLNDPSYFDKFSDDLKAVCQCHNIQLVEVQGLMSDHVLFNRRQGLRVVKHVQ
jgi:hypothetical protein